MHVCGAVCVIRGERKYMETDFNGEESKYMENCKNDLHLNPEFNSIIAEEEVRIQQRAGRKVCSVI